MKILLKCRFLLDLQKDIDFIPTGDRDADMAVSRANELGEYAAINNTVNPKKNNIFPENSYAKLYQEYVEDQDINAQLGHTFKYDKPNKWGNYPQLVYERGIPKSSPENRFPKDADLRSLKRNTLLGDIKLKHRKGRNKNSNELNDKLDREGTGKVTDITTGKGGSEVAYYDTLDRDIKIGSKLFNSYGFDEEDINDIILHEVTHWAQFLHLGFERTRKLVGRAYDQYKKTGKVPLIERMATMAQRTPKNAFYRNFSRSELDREEGRYQPNSQEERERYMKQWNRLSKEDKRKYKEIYNAMKKEWKRFDNDSKYSKKYKEERSLWEE